MRYVGQKIKRREDARLITGRSRYVDDIKLPGMLYASVLRSVHAHAWIRSIKIEGALELPGVVAAITGDQVKDKIGPLPCLVQFPDLKVPAHHALALDKVRYVGEPIAAVVANDPYIARDALDLIEVEYEPLPAVVDPEKALEKETSPIHEGLGGNAAFTWKREAGDVDAAFRDADLIIKQRVINQRLIPMALEPRGVIALYGPVPNTLTIWSSTQMPHLLRTQLAGILNLPENRIRVIAPEVGGAFGSKGQVYGEEALVAYLAMKTQRPVKWVETRRENFMATIHGRGMIFDAEAAARSDGTLLGLRCRIISDLGAYFQLFTPLIPTMAAMMLCGPYRIPSVSVEVVGVFTNKMSTDAYRGAGRPEATCVLERMIDRIAGELGLDPAEVRHRNLIGKDEFPYQTPMGPAYDSGDYQAALNKALEMLGYNELRQEQKRLRERGKYIGIGISTYVEMGALGPSAAAPIAGWESATVRVEPTGKVTVITGSSPHGQGQETSFSQIVADELGVEFDDVNVVHGDTSVVQYGIGTFASRATAVGGTALLMALSKIKEKSMRFAAHLLGAGARAVMFERGRFYLRDNRERSLTLSDIAEAAYSAKNLPPDTEPGLEATSFFEPANFTFPFGTHIAVVEVDAETGETKVIKYIAVDDCGRVINPLMVDGQIHGGVAQGIGQALYEEAIYDENGQLITGELMDYAVMKAQYAPWIETARTVTPSPVNPLGAKGVGEAGTIAAPAAILNAVVDALSPFGVKHIESMPLKPEKIWRLIKSSFQRGLA